MCGGGADPRDSRRWWQCVFCVTLLASTFCLFAVAAMTAGMLWDVPLMRAEVRPLQMALAGGGAAVTAVVAAVSYVQFRNAESREWERLLED